MTGAVDWSTLLWLVGLVVGVAMSSLLVGWRVLSWALTQLKARDDEIGKVRDDVHESNEKLNEYKTHVAEVYVTKKGMAEQTEMIMKAINDVGTRLETRVDGLGARLDRFYEGQPSPRTRDRS